MADEDRHPDLERFYEALLAEEDDEFYPDDDEDDEDDDEMYLDPDDMEGEIDDEDGNAAFYLHDLEALAAEEDDDDAMDLQDEDDEGYEDEEDDEDDDGGQQYISLQELLSAAGGTVQARSSILAQSSAGSGGPASGTRSGGFRFRSSPIDPEERARASAERRRRERWWEPQTEPHPRGSQSLRSGEFGSVGPWRQKRARMLVPRRSVRPVAQATVPNSHGTVVASYPSIPYVGQYAGADYGLFYTATQNFTLHLYNTAQARPTPRRPRNEPESPVNSQGSRRIEEESGGVDEYDIMEQSFGGGMRRGMPTEDTSLKKIKNVQGVPGNWTITDCDADKKAEKMIYSSITPYVHMLYTSEDDQEHIELDFSARRRGRGAMYGYDSFGLWSVRFSADGKEVVAGASDGKIMVYDIEAQHRSLSVPGHTDDVNAVCFADESSTNILVSGADDGYVKVWDRRSLSSSTPSGVLVGATEGITYTSPKGDGRYIIANSKDQAARSYDSRKMRSHSEFEAEPDAVSRYGQPHFDYRSARYPRPSILAHPKDCSVMTYRGHSVSRTSIRCHFSPRESTGQSYIYSGSADGMIHIWSSDGRVVQVLNRAQSAPSKKSNGEYSDPSAPDPVSSTPNYYDNGQSWTVRDVAWHGYEPTLMSTCWEVDGGYRRGGNLAKHEWKGLGKGGMRRSEDWVEKQTEEMKG